MTALRHQSVGSIVTEHFSTALVFKEVGIDFCCGGAQSLQEAAAEKKLDIDALENQLVLQALSGDSTLPDFKTFQLDFLADYLVNVYHTKARAQLPQLKAYTEKIADVHGANHPELLEIAACFNVIHTSMPDHMKDEEDVLFPAIKEALLTHSPAAFEVIKAEQHTLLDDHVLIGGTMDKIRTLSHDYLLPEDGCNTYMVTYKLLEAFEDDLHIHVHLENNLLFPKALALTQA